ncbi:MAG: multicomponent Na+:H+ antiporter subunit [Thermosipho sp. (in: thermotogales)]|nr:multicomponent Na+:H+ antiporter subunit [Thermosipho sp. (in: thermotogales)]MDN5324817.1 multicomponent Na+:H+ antiporter subunit [Thermosipho sp. (in: thermotogales)]
MSIIQISLIYFGVTLMILNNVFALKSKNLLKKIHFISAGDTAGGILILISLMFSKLYFSKSLIALLILLIGSPSVTYFIAYAITKRGKKIGNS